MIVSNFKNGSFFLKLNEFYRFIFLKFEPPSGIADLTPPEADQMPSRIVNYGGTTSSL
jgi:hypothetical protein